MEIVIVLAPLRKHGPNPSYTEDRTLSPESLRYKTPISRFRQFVRDPSEAPQSDRIEHAYTRHCTGKMRHIGGTMIHLCAPTLIGAGHGNNTALLTELIAHDQNALSKGFSHFATANWIKP